MEKFKEALIQFANSNPNLSQNNNNSSTLIIQQRFSQFFPDFQTPNHPPYAAMIHKAIWELNKKGGSSEESISKYIKKEYADLPWAHSTLLKHHLEKLCDGKEICITHKQRYSLPGADTDIDPVSSSTLEKPLERKRNSESGKKNSGPCKKLKKMKSGLDTKPGKTSIRQRRKRKRKEISMVDIQETDKQITVRDEDVQPLDEMVDEQEVDLEIQDQSEKILSITEFDEIGNGNQSVELRNEVEANLKQNNEVTGSDIQIQEENNDDEQVQMMQNPQLLQLEQSPHSNHLLLKGGKRIYTRSQIKSTCKKDASASSELANPPTNVNLSEEKEHRLDIIEVKEAKQAPSAVSSQMNGQRAKLRSTQKNTLTEPTDMETKQKSTSPSLEKRLIEVDETTQVQETGSSEQDQQPKELKNEIHEDKPRKRGRPKKSQQSAEKSKAGSRCSKRKRVENERLGKSKSANKKNQPKNKRHKMTRRNTKKKSK